MKKSSKLLAIIAAGIFSAGCMSLESGKILRKHDKYGGYELTTVYSGKLDNKPYKVVEFKDKDYRHYSAKMIDDELGTITLDGQLKYFRFIDSPIAEERGIIFEEKSERR